MSDRWAKWPRTSHLPWSETVGWEDQRIISLDNFIGKEVVVTEKLDGENTSLYKDGLHARSLDYRPHQSRNWVTALQAVISSHIPEAVKIIGENLYAKHAILYEKLPSYFIAFSVIDDNLCCSWDEVESWCEYFKYTMRFEDGNFYQHPLFTAPVLYRGIWDEDKVRACYTGKSVYGGEQEGYVVRLANEFPIQEYNVSAAKFVRPNHVQPNEGHWFSKQVIPNKLEPLSLNLLKHPKYGF